MSYRDDVAALEARAEALHDEAAAKLDELDRARRLVAEARTRVRATFLEVQLASPCMANWAEMVGDDRSRRCERCRKQVYNFSALTRDEIDALVVEYEGALCARFFVRADGTMLTKDCTMDLRLRPRGFGVAIAIGAAALAVGIAVAAEAKHGAPAQVDESEANMGGVRGVWRASQ